MSEAIKMMVHRYPLILEAYRGVNFNQFNPQITAREIFGSKFFPRFIYLGGFAMCSGKRSLLDVKGGYTFLKRRKFTKGCLKKVR